MPTFEYQALTRDGRPTRGSLAAESAAAARHMLRNRQLHATQLRPVSEAAQAARFQWARLFRAGRRRKVLDFTRQLATMVDADIKLTEALSVLSSQTADARLCQVIQNIRDQVVAGEALADGLKQYRDWFDPIYVSMVHVGEVTGNLGPTLKLLADYLAKRIRLDAKIKSALTYPAFLVVVCLGVITVLMTFVVPRLTRIIEESGRAVPGVTRLLMGVSRGLVNWWWVILVVVGLLAYAGHRVLAHPRGRLGFDRLLLRLPLFGRLLRQSILARFTGTLAALMRSGLPMAESLKVVAEVTGSTVMTHAIQAARERIIAGADIATPLQQSGVVDPALGHMIAVGERSGELEGMLVTIAESLEENTDIIVQRLSAVVEPAVIVVMAVLVGFIMFGTLWPILEVSSIKM